MKYIFIVNPASGNKDYKQIIDNIHSNMINKDYKIIETKGPNHAVRIANKYKSDKDVIIYSVGGDGTLNEVINGLAGGNCKLGIIPTGSGNDFYKSLVKYSKKESTIDLGAINDKFYFINIASVGFDAEVSDAANKIKSTGHFKKLSYYLGIIKTFVSFRTSKYEVIVNGKKYYNKYTLIAVCNGRYYGGGFQIAPLASFDDDLFDVYFANKISRIRLLGLFFKLLNGKHEKSPMVSKIKTTEILIKCDKDMIVNIDGEIIRLKKADIKIVPNAINLYNDKELVKNILGE